MLHGLFVEWRIAAHSDDLAALGPGVELAKFQALGAVGAASEHAGSCGDSWKRGVGLGSSDSVGRILREELEQLKTSRPGDRGKVLTRSREGVCPARRPCLSFAARRCN